MVKTDTYIIPCDNLFNEKITNDLVKNKEEIASDFLKKMRIGFDMKIVDDKPQHIMLIKMETTLFKNEMVVLPIDNQNRSLADLFNKTSQSFNIDLLANEIVKNNGINRFNEKYQNDYDTVKKECKLVKIRLEGLTDHFQQLEIAEKGKALGKIFIEKANQKNPLFTNKNISFELYITPDIAKSKMQEIKDLFENEMQKIGFKKDNESQEQFDDGTKSIRIENPKRKIKNAISLHKGNESIIGEYQEEFGIHSNMRTTCFWNLECKLKGESLSTFKKVLEKLPKHELTSHFQQFKNIESLAYQNLKKMGFKDFMYSPNYKYNGKKTRNTKGLTAKEIEAIDLIEKWAKEHKVRNKRGYYLSYYPSTENPKYAFNNLLKEAKRNGFSYQKEKDQMER